MWTQGGGLGGGGGGGVGDGYSDEYSLSGSGVELDAIGVGVGGGGGEGGGGDSDDVDLGPFFEGVEVVKGMIGRVENNVERIAEQHGLSLGATSTEEAADCSQLLSDLMNETDRLTKSIRARLGTMEEENAAFAEEGGKGSAEDRIRSNAYGTLTRKFIAVMREYQELQTEYRNKYKDRVERQVRIVKRDATQEEIEEIVDGTGGTEIFAQLMLSSSAHAAAENALADIRERHDDIIRLERSIAELHQLFVDMAVLVEAQGELLDQIEHSVAQSVNYTEKAVGELAKANKYARKARKKMCCLLVVGSMGLAAILIPSLAVGLRNA